MPLRAVLAAAQLVPDRMGRDRGPDEPVLPGIPFADQCPARSSGLREGQAGWRACYRSFNGI